MASRNRRDDGALWGAEGADQLWTGDEIEVAAISRQTGVPAIHVRRAMMKVGGNRARILAELRELHESAYRAPVEEVLWPGALVAGVSEGAAEYRVRVRTGSNIIIFRLSRGEFTRRFHDNGMPPAFAKKWKDVKAACIVAYKAAMPVQYLNGRAFILLDRTHFLKD